MKQKDLKIDFRYLTGNIACLSVDSINGESVHNDINNEEAIIIFNSLVGEKADCQTVKSLLKENQKLQEKYENAVSDYETTMADKNELKKQVENYKKLGFKYLMDKNNNLENQQQEFIKYLEDYLKLFDYMCIDEQADYDMIEEILQKYKEIIGDDKNDK